MYVYYISYPKTIKDELEVDENWKPMFNHTLLSDNGCPYPQDYIEVRA